MLSAAAWVYLVFVILILATMIARKNVVVPAVMGTFVVAIVFTGSLLTGISAIYNSSLVAAVNLFNIFLIIALVTAMQGALEDMGADRKMVAPFQKVMTNAHAAFWTLAIVTYFISLFFWPTPAVPLIGAVLMPVAIRAGLPAMTVGLAVAIAGQGMALSSDYVIRVAPGLSATAAGGDANVVADRSMVLSLIVGGIALVIAYLIDFRKMRKPSDELLERWLELEETGVIDDYEELEDVGTFYDQDALTGTTTGGGTDVMTRPARPASPEARATAATGGGDAGARKPALGGGNGNGSGQPKVSEGIATAFAIIVPVAFLALLTYMIVAKFAESVPDLAGGDAAALVGGIATLLLFFACLFKDKADTLETAANHVVDGLVFAFKAMGVVLPIAGFFFLSSSDFSGQILGLPEDAEAPSFLTDLVNAATSHIPATPMVAGFGVMIVGIIAGLDGSGFSGLPLTGALAGSLGPASGASVDTLAAVGQMGNIWSGGGTLVAWSSLLAVAGFARVSAVDLARKAFIPVIIGLFVCTIFAMLFFTG